VISGGARRQGLEGHPALAEKKGIYCRKRLERNKAISLGDQVLLRFLQPIANRPPQVAASCRNSLASGVQLRNTRMLHSHLYGVRSSMLMNPLVSQ